MKRTDRCKWKCFAVAITVMASVPAWAQDVIPTPVPHAVKPDAGQPADIALPSGESACKARNTGWGPSCLRVWHCRSLHSLVLDSS